MSPANLFVTEVPAAQPPPAEPALPAQPVTTSGHKPFANIMESTIADDRTAPVSKKNPHGSEGDQKKNDTALALLAGPLVSAPAILPVAPLPPCGQTQSIVTADIVAPGQTNGQGPDLATPIHAADATPLGVPASPVTPHAPAVPNGSATSDTATAADVSTLLPSVAQAPLPMPAAGLPENAPSITQTAAQEQTGKNTDPAVAASAAELESLLSSDGEVHQAQIDGTVIAKENYSMKRGVKADKNSAPAEKTLPRGNFSTITKAEAARPSRDREAFSKDSTESARSSREPFIPREKPTTIYGTTVAEFKPFDVKVSTDEAGVDGVRAPQVEKVFNEVSEQVVAFKKVGVNSMDAVLRPDRGTEISLHLSLGDNGQVDVVARVERGSFEGLQAHWNELQSSLAQQGVRVGELHQSSLTNNQASFQNSPQHLGGTLGEQQQAQRQASRSPETLDELSLVGSTIEPSKGKTSTLTATSRRGWEKWA
jgi:hypothetical protein